MHINFHRGGVANYNKMATGKFVNRDVGTFDFPLHVKRILVSSLFSAVTFPVTLGLTHAAVLKPLKISTRSPKLLGITAGVLTVSSASLISSIAGVTGYIISNEGETGSKSKDLPPVSLKVRDLIYSAGLGVVVYRVLGGRFTSVLPSHYWGPGAFAREWLPAQVEYASSIERQLIQEIGSRRGCHSCGNFTSKYISDHQPPNAILKKQLSPGQDLSSYMSRQRFYPHCESCSKKQGHSLLYGASPLTLHSLHLRPYHAFLPIPLTLAYYKYITSQEIQAQSPIPKPVVDVVDTPPKQPTAQEIPNALPLDTLTSFESFPLFLLWKSAVSFFDYFPTVASFHLTLWLFTVVAALGTI